MNEWRGSKVYTNQKESVSHIRLTPSPSSFLLSFLYELSTNVTSNFRLNVTAGTIISW